jgi:hypothetical protein
MGPKALAVVLVMRTLAYGDCWGGSVAGSKNGSTAVFRGRVVAVEQYGQTKRGRNRQKVRFRVSELWKGPDDAEITLYDLNPLVGCDGFGFQLGVEYIVFAREEIVSRNLALGVNGKILNDDWRDVVPQGTRILTASNSNCCNPTSELTTAKETIRLLGPGIHARPTE